MLEEKPLDVQLVELEEHQHNPLLPQVVVEVDSQLPLPLHHPVHHHLSRTMPAPAFHLTRQHPHLVRHRHHHQVVEDIWDINKCLNHLITLQVGLKIITDRLNLIVTDPDHVRAAVYLANKQDVGHRFYMDIDRDMGGELTVSPHLNHLVVL